MLVFLFFVNSTTSSDVKPYGDSKITYNVICDGQYNVCN